MRASSTNTSVIATQRWVEFRNEILVKNDPKLATKLNSNWGKVLSFMSDSFYK